MVLAVVKIGNFNVGLEINLLGGTVAPNKTVMREITIAESDAARGRVARRGGVCQCVGIRFALTEGMVGEPRIAGGSRGVGA